MNARDLNAMLQSAVACLRESELHQAESLCRQILSHRSNEADVHHLLGRVLLAGGRNDEAMESLRRAAAIKPSAAILQYDLGEAAWRRRDFRAAAGAFGRALELDPSMINAQAALG